MEQIFSFSGIKELELFAKFCLFVSRNRVTLEKNAISINDFARGIEETRLFKNYTRIFLWRLRDYKILIPSKYNDSVYYVD